MQRSLRHRGPDDEGLFLAHDGDVGLVNTRLSILDLSTAGHQPNGLGPRHESSSRHSDSLGKGKRTEFGTAGMSTCSYTIKR
jgi:hypothetical protein